MINYKLNYKNNYINIIGMLSSIVFIRNYNIYLNTQNKLPPPKNLIITNDNNEN